MNGRRVITVLLFTPIYWLQMLEFRPESMLLLCGFASYMVLARSRRTGKYWLYGLSGLLAGWAGLTHAFGLVFVLAGLLGLVFERKWQGGVVFLVFGLLGFCPYVSGYFTNRELFIAQAVHNPLMTTSFDLNWWQPLVNLVTEHKRVLRKPEVIGITVWMLLALPLINREFWQRNRFTFVYLFAAAIVLAASPLPKFTRYMIPLVPFMAIIIAQVWSSLESLGSTKPKYFTTAFSVWGIVFFAYGTFALFSEALPRNQNQIQTNDILAQHMEKGSLVMTPFDFVFMQQGNYTIQSWWGADRAAGNKKSVSFLEDYADSLGVKYLIADPVVLAAWNIDEKLLSSTFSRYNLIFSIPEQHRYLLARVDGASPAR